MANENTPSVAGAENASTGPSIGDLIQNVNPANLKKAIEATKQEFAREAADIQRALLRTQQAIAENLTSSRVITGNPIIDQAAEIFKVAISEQACKADSPDCVAQKNPTEGADPVDLATGQLIYSFTDLHLDGAGINFDFKRNYRSKGLYPNGPLGVCWDYSLNLWLREMSRTEVVLNTEDFREDHFTLVQGTNDGQSYYSPPDGYHAILESQNGVYILTRPDGMRYEYASLNNNPIFNISKIVDRFGNFLLFDYTQLPTLRIIVNDINLTRVVQIRFDDLKRIIAIVDYSGRSVLYNYDDYDDLINVTLPPTKDYPFGRTFFYEYSSEFGPVKHQLLSVIDAEGRRYLEIEYGKNENFIDNERVIRQRDDEGEWLLEYADLIPDDPDDITKPNRYTMMVKPTGHCIEYWFNKNGNALVKAETVYDENNIKRQFITRTLYNIDGNIIAQLSPENVFNQFIYGRDLFDHNNAPGIVPTMRERKTFGNLLTQIKRVKAGFNRVFDAVTGTWTTPSPFNLFNPLDLDYDSEDIIIDYSYEPLFQQIATKSDPRFPINPNYFTRYVYTAIGELEQIIYPETTGPDPADISKSNEIDFFEYDPIETGKIFRKSLKRIDPIMGMIKHPDNHETEYTYYLQVDKEASEYNGLRNLFLTPPPKVTLKGHIAAITMGKGEPDESETKFGINTRGINIKVTDARLNLIEYDIDSTDQPFSVKKNLTNAVNYQTNFKYTREGKVRKSAREVADKNGNLLLPEPETTHYRYNDFGLMLSQRLGGNDFHSGLLTRHVYNAEGLVQRIISPGKSITSIRYDQRRLPAKTIMGFGTVDAVTTKIKYNGNGQKRAVEDGAGNVTRYDYDTFGRLVCTVQVVDIAVGLPDKRLLNDRQGHSYLLKYDKLNNITEERFFEWVQPDTYKLLSFKQYEFDQRGRKIKTINHLFEPGATTHTGQNWLKDLQSAVAIPNTIPIESWIFYDGNGRVKEQREGVVTVAGIQSPGSSVLTKYDYAGRVINQLTRLLDKNIVVTELKNSYDLNGNLTRSDRFDYEYDAGNRLINTEIISSGAEYDSLNRKIKDIDGLGNVTSYEYDSRDALIKKIDALGNITSFEYDIYGRKIKMLESPNPGQTIVTQYEYNADGQLTSVSRGNPAFNNLVTTTYKYNTLQKRIKKTLAAGTNIERPYDYVYDKTGLLRETITPNQVSAKFFYDRMNRVVKIDYDNSQALNNVVNDAAELFLFDGLGRILKATNDSSEVRYVYDSLGRVIEEEQELLGVGIFTIKRSYDFLNNYDTLIYPSGRTLQYKYDLAGRQLQIADIKRGSPNISKPGGGIRIVITKTFVGQRERLNKYDNGTSTLYQYDRIGRIISIDHKDNNNASLLGLLQLYDENGNRGADWQTGSEAKNNGCIYNYDGLNRLIKSGQNNAVFPAIAAFAPVSFPAQPLSGQAAINAAMGNVMIPAGSAEPQYGYDDWSNRLNEKSALVNNAELFDELGELKNGKYAYDFNGNLVKSSTRVFKYDQHNHLIAVTDAGLNFSCIYDATGRRLQINDSNIITSFAYDVFAEIASYKNNVLHEEFIIASQPDGRVGYASKKKDYFVYHDIVGSTRLVTDSVGVVNGRYEYEPYGRRPNIIQDFAGFRYLFMGRAWDDTIQLYHFRARHYDVNTGRFLQNDPVESMDNKSLYQAFGSNPLLFVDNTGKREKSIHIQNNMDPDLISPFIKKESFTAGIVGKTWDAFFEYSFGPTLYDSSINAGASLLRSKDDDKSSWYFLGGNFDFKRAGNNDFSLNTNAGVYGFQTGKNDNNFRVSGDLFTVKAEATFTSKRFAVGYNAAIIGVGANLGSPAARIEVGLSEGPSYFVEGRYGIDTDNNGYGEYGLHVDVDFWSLGFQVEPRAFEEAMVSMANATDYISPTAQNKCEEPGFSESVLYSGY
jgi:RHS repeat-associated protein